MTTIIKKISKKFTIMLLVFAMSLGALSVNVFAETNQVWKTSNYKGDTFYTNCVGPKMSLNEVQVNKPYILGRDLCDEDGNKKHTSVYRIFVKKITKETFEGWSIYFQKNISVKRNEVQWAMDLIPYNQEGMSIDGLNYCKNVFGEQVDQYDVKINTPYVIADYSVDPDKIYFSVKRVYVQSVFEDPHFLFAWLGSTRTVKGIDLDTGKSVTVAIGNGNNKVYSLIRK